jgi:MYXO-CTERM domain-containing protein
MLLVTAVADNVITFTPPLFWDFDDAPQLTGFSGIMARFTGVEDLLIDHEGGAEGPSFLFDQCYACWARGVHSRLPLAYHAVEVNNLHCELRDSFFDDSQTYGPNNGGLVLYGTNTAWKVENNIFHKTFPGIECQNGTSGNYFGYNFGSWVEAGWEYSGVMFSDNHGPHDMMNLWEGNVGEMFQSDGYFGSASHATLFRNHFTAYNPHKLGNFKAVSLERWSYHYNIVANLLGDPDTSYAFYEADVDNYGLESATIFRLGYPNIGNNSFQSYDGKSPPGIDPMVEGTLLRQGNYDYFHDCVWDDAAGACLDAAAAEGLALPDSLHHAARPNWWPPAKPWPPFAPDRPGFDADAPVKIPAHDCFDNLDLANGGAFDPDACYPIFETTTGDTSDDTGDTDDIDDTGDTGDTGPDDPTGGPGTTGADVPTGSPDPGSESGATPSTGPDQDEQGDGCGCTTGPVTPAAWLLALVGLRRRRRR